ncbi:thioredoxin domain-containing protein [Streptomyces sp. NPDC060194]|uniref:thioredoxin domain-containing protein n=1 Tax=Streptomyces sp. NPDC060194 TaxID=3347069 RepID=UPI00364E61E0
MSKRNNQASKNAARERLRAEREAAARRAKTRRTLVVAASVVGVLAVAGGVGALVVQNNKPTYWESAADQKLVRPANTTGADGTTVVIGKDSAKKTVKLYEDPRCPVCATFEQNVGDTIHKDVDKGAYKIQFVGGAFLDRNLQGTGSKNGLSALGAALNVSDQAFLDYKAAMFSAKWHPDESTDKLADDAYLIEIADTVPALKDNQAFAEDVKDGTYDKWALNMAESFDDNKDGVQGTPSVVVDGKLVYGEGTESAPSTAAAYRTAIDKALAGS